MVKPELIFTHVANTVSHAAGKAVTFGLCVLAVLAWAVTGPYFDYSDTWQLIINTSTTIITENEVDQLRKDIERKVRARAKGGHGRLPEEGAQSRHRGETR